MKKFFFVFVMMLLCVCVNAQIFDAFNRPDRAEEKSVLRIDQPTKFNNCKKNYIGGRTGFFFSEKSFNNSLPYLGIEYNRNFRKSLRVGTSFLYETKTKCVGWEMSAGFRF